jgi:transcriptional regulator NrdR family protein
VRAALHDVRAGRGRAAAGREEGRARGAFDREKVLRGLRWRATSASRHGPLELEKFVDELERELIESEKEVEPASIGERVMPKLRELDEVAYVRFASVYRSSATSTSSDRSSRRCPRSRARKSTGPEA